MNLKKKSDRHTKQIKVYMSADELYQIQKIAAARNVPAGRLLRQTALYGDYDKIGIAKTADLATLSKLINDEEHIYADILGLTFDTDSEGLGEEYRGKFEEAQKDLGEAYGDLRSDTRRKREKVVHEIGAMLRRENAKAPHSYEEDDEKRDRKLCIALSEEEWDRIHEICKKEDCSISCFMKYDTLTLYKDGRYIVNCDSLDAVNGKIEFQLKFLSALRDNLPDNITDRMYYENILNILHGITDFMREQDKTVDLSTGQVRIDARAACRMPGSFAV